MKSSTSTTMQTPSLEGRESLSVRKILSERPAISTAASAHIALIRGLAAIAVLIGHARNLFFIDYVQVQHPNPWLAAAYGTTVFGRQAVMVFFVLSGYLIGSSVLRSVERNQWSTTRYCLHRLVRLEIVLFPALLLGLAWDLGGIHHFGLQGIYGGHAQGSVMSYSVPQTISWPIVAGNIAFLQSIQVPCLGSNNPLWSLSYEFWYYALFPCIILMFARRGRSLALSVLLGVAVAVFMGRYLLTYFPIWLLGTVIYFLPKPKRFRFAPAMTGIAGCLFGLDLWLTKVFWQNAYVSDFSVAICFAFFLYWLLHLPSKVSERYIKATNTLAASSFTLYVTHMPFLVFIAAWNGTRREPTPLHMLFLGGLVLLVWIYARIVYMCFERNTNNLRSWLERKLLRINAPCSQL